MNKATPTRANLVVLKQMLNLIPLGMINRIARKTGIASWFMKSVAGIRPDPESPGFQQFIIQPVIGGDLTFARASTESPYGTIVSEWTRADDRLKLNLEIPPNSSATLRIPTSTHASFGGGGDLPAGLTLVRQDPRHIVLTALSGRYQLDVPMVDEPE